MPEGLRINGEWVPLAQLKQGISADQPWETDIRDTISSWLDETEEMTLRTSGSTGAPKTITLPKTAMRRSALATLETLKLGRGARFHLCIPAGYIGGKMMIIRALISQGQLTYEKPSGMPQIPDGAPPADLTAMVPIQVDTVLSEPRMQKEPTRLSRYGKVIIGGAPLDPELERRIKNSDLSAWQTFGMTETSSHIALRPLSGSNASDTFYCLNGFEVSTDERGSLQIDGRQMGLGELKTTDLVEVYSPTSFRWLGRADHVINSGGVKVQPEKVEYDLSEQIHVPFFIYGAADNRLGQKVVICIEGEVQPIGLNEALDSIGRYERPKEVWLVPQFSRTGSGKVKRVESAEAAVSKHKT